jgi:hypothetical protein
MCGFCRITDLGILHFNFSSKNCSSKLYTCLEKVVVLVTLSTAKSSLLFLDFSTMLYDFSKLQVKHTKEEGTFCEWPLENFKKITDRPLVCTKLPGTIWGFVMWSKEARGSAAGWIPARLAAGVAEKVAREGLGIVGIRLRGLLTVERQPTVGCGGRRWQRPLGALLQRACSSAWPTSGCGSFAGARGRREQHLSAVKSGRRWSSPWAPMGGNGGSVVRCSLARRTVKRFYSRASRPLGVPCTPRRGGRQYMSRHGQGPATTCSRYWPTAGGGAAVQPVEMHRMAWHREPTDVMHRVLEAAHGPTDARVPRCAGQGEEPRRHAWHGAGRAFRRSGTEQCNVPLFDCHFLTMFELKCYKHSIPKL